MKILFVTPAFYRAIYYGGPIYSTYELAKALKRQEFDVRVITTNSKLKLVNFTDHKMDFMLKNGKSFY